MLKKSLCFITVLAILFLFAGLNARAGSGAATGEPITKYGAGSGAATGGPITTYGPWQIEVTPIVIIPVHYKDYVPDTRDIKVLGNTIIGRAWLNVNNSSVFDENILIKDPVIGKIIHDAIEQFGYGNFHFFDDGTILLPPFFPDISGGFWLVGTEGNLNVESSSYEMKPYLNIVLGMKPWAPPHYFPEKTWLSNLKLVFGVGWHEESAEIKFSTNYGYLEGQGGIELQLPPIGRCPPRYWWIELAGGLEKAYGTFKWDLRDIYGIVGLRYNHPINLRGDSKRDWFTGMSVVAGIEYWPTWRHEDVTWSGMKTNPLPLSGVVVQLSEPFSEDDDSFVHQGHASVGLGLTVWKNPRTNATFDSVKIGGGGSMIFGETSTGELVYGVHAAVTVPFN